MLFVANFFRARMLVTANNPTASFHYNLQGNVVIPILKITKLTVSDAFFTRYRVVQHVSNFQKRIEVQRCYIAQSTLITSLSLWTVLSCTGCAGCWRVRFGGVFKGGGGGSPPTPKWQNFSFMFIFDSKNGVAGTSFNPPWPPKTPPLPKFRSRYALGT